MEIQKKLLTIQSELKAPKNQTNNFGHYKYRSCEDILEAVKPLLKKEGLVLTITDELVNIGERYYIKATVNIEGGEERISVNSYARESENKKGMDESQITGTASSYARKYALNGMFLIDDTKDADTMDNSKEVKPDIQKNITEIMKLNTIEELKKYWEANKGLGAVVAKAITSRKKEIEEMEAQSKQDVS